MFRIRSAQMAAFREAAAREFDGRMVRHIERFFPLHGRILGAEQLRAVAEHGRARAACHHFTSRRDVCLYVTLMVLLGSNFDVDVCLPWVRQILHVDRSRSPAARIDRLADQAMHHVDRLAGTRDVHLTETLVRLRAELGTAVAPLSSRPFAEQALARMLLLFPRKYEVLGEPALARLVELGVEEARRHAIPSEWGALAYTMFMFVLGSSFDRDPQFPWAARALFDRERPDPDERIERLCRGAVDHLELHIQLRTTKGA